MDAISSFYSKSLEHDLLYASGFNLRWLKYLFIEI